MKRIVLKNIMLFVTACALYNDSQEILLQQRPIGKPMAGLWEFPGGKVESLETPEGALIRELREELSIEVAHQHLQPLSFVTHPLNLQNKQPDQHNAQQANASDSMLLLLLYTCSMWQGTLTPQEGQIMKWVSKDTLSDYPMPPADVPLIAFL